MASGRSPAMPTTPSPVSVPATLQRMPSGIRLSAPGSIGPSATDPGLTVLRLDYRSVEENPATMRRVLDELVQIDHGLFLGQALFRRRGGLERVAWFALEAEG